MVAFVRGMRERWQATPTPRRWIIGAVAVGCVVAVGVARNFSGRGSVQVDELEALTVVADVADITVQVETTGEVQPIERVNLSPKTQGRLDRIFVEQGDRVEQGQVIAEMENRELVAQYDRAVASLERARAGLRELQNGTRPEELAQGRARVDRATANRDRATAALDELLAGSRREDLREAEAALTRSESAVVEAESRLSLAEIDLERDRQLEADGAISRRELDTSLDELRRAQAGLDSTIAARSEARQRRDRLANGARPEEVDRAEADLDAAEADLAEARQQLAQLKNGARPEEVDRAEADVLDAQGNVDFYAAQLDDTKVRAPFSGVVVQRYADPGAFVTPATSASTASSATSTSIVALARGLEILAKVPEVDIDRIYRGQAVEVVADAHPDDRFEAEVKLIAPEAVREQNVTLFQVRLEILSGLERLQSGMNADLTFQSDRLEDVLVVPTVAVVTDRGQSGVLVPDARGRAKFRPVTVGPSVGSQVQVLDGLDAGERVFIGLPEGQDLDDILGGLDDD